MKDDKNSKEADGRVAAALEWACEFEARGLGVIGLQECRVRCQAKWTDRKENVIARFIPETGMEKVDTVWDCTCTQK